MSEDDKLIQSVFHAIQEHAPLAFSDRKPVAAVRSTDPDDVFARCGDLSHPTIAREVSSLTGRKIRSVTSDHPQKVNTHRFMEDVESGEIIDPAAATFLRIPQNVRDKHKGTLLGNMFVGTRKQLKAIVDDPDVKITRCSTSADKKISFGRIWGEKGMIHGVDNPDEFYGSK